MGRGGWARQLLGSWGVKGSGAPRPMRRNAGWAAAGPQPFQSRRSLCSIRSRDALGSKLPRPTSSVSFRTARARCAIGIRHTINFYIARPSCACSAPAVRGRLSPASRARRKRKPQRLQDRQGWCS